MKNQYKLRIVGVFFFFTLCYAIVGIHLYTLQIKRHDFFTELGNKQYATLVTTYPPRAPILDRHGTSLAMNIDSLAAFITPAAMKDGPAVHTFLEAHFPQAYQRLLQSPKSSFMYIARRLTNTEQELIMQAGIPDLYLMQEPSRFYPLAAAGTVIGLTNIDNQGSSGLELLYNEQLAGKPTTQRMHKDAHSGYMRIEASPATGIPGTPLTTSLDATLQFFTFEALAETVNKFQAKEGAAIIMDPATGQVLAMASYPSFDPNDTRTLVMEHTKNKAVTEVYEFGSVIKVFAALAAFEQGVVTPEEPIDCENVVTTYSDGRKINTVPASVAGIIPFSSVIEKSNNIGIAKVVKRLGTDLYTHYLRMGFGAKTGIEFPGEREGFVNPPQQWSKQSIISLSYGYEITATLLQLAQAFSLIANDGYLIRPTLMLSSSNPVNTERRYSQHAVTIMKEILENTVLRGTAQKARIQGYRVMSKTGTANMLINGVYDNTQNCYTCGGIIEDGTYKRVIVVFIKQAARKGLYASTVAVPLFEYLAEKTLIHEKRVSSRNQKESP